MHLLLIKTESSDKILWDTLYRNLKSDMIDENWELFQVHTEGTI